MYEDIKLTLTFGMQKQNPEIILKCYAHINMPTYVSSCLAHILVYSHCIKIRLFYFIILIFYFGYIIKMIS